MHLFYVAEVEGNGAAVNGDVHVGLDKSDFPAVFPLKGDGRVRLSITFLLTAAPFQLVILAYGFIAECADHEWMQIQINRVNWFSTYRVHHRVANNLGGVLPGLDSSGGWTI
jgi:hypothetical protein